MTKRTEAFVGTASFSGFDVGSGKIMDVCTSLYTLCPLCPVPSSSYLRETIAEVVVEMVMVVILLLVVVLLGDVVLGNVLSSSAARGFVHSPVHPRPGDGSIMRRTAVK